MVFIENAGFTYCSTLSMSSDVHLLNLCPMVATSVAIPALLRSGSSLPNTKLIWHSVGAIVLDMLTSGWAIVATVAHLSLTSFAQSGLVVKFLLLALLERRARPLVDCDRHV